MCREHNNSSRTKRSGDSISGRKEEAEKGERELRREVKGKAGEEMGKEMRGGMGEEVNDEAKERVGGKPREEVKEVKGVGDGVDSEVNGEVKQMNEELLEIKETAALPKKKEEKLLEHEDEKLIAHKEEKMLDNENKDEKLIPHEEHRLLENRYSELQEQVVRLQAEFENFQKRTQKESDARANEGKVSVMSDLLVVLDEMEEARKHTKDEGVEMVFSKFVGTLRSHGLSEVDNSGIYSPQWHEVVGTRLSDKPEGTIIDVARKGYMVAGNVLRPSMVIISKKGE